MRRLENQTLTVSDVCKMRFILFSKVKIIMLILSTFQLLIGLSCNEEPTPAIIPVPGKRDYTWTVDTLSYPGSFQTLMRNIWASSPSDVYVVGHNDQNRGLMYHYDGIKWSPVKLLVIEGGGVQTAPIDLSAVYGFAPNDVWAVGEHIYQNPSPPPNFLDSSLIMHFDGMQWSEIPVTKGRYLSTLWGSNKNDIWFGGAWGTLYHFDGRTCAKVAFDSLSTFSFMAGFSSSNIYATVNRKIDFVQPLDSSEIHLYYYNGNKWSSIDSFLVYPHHSAYKFGYTLWGSPEGHLYSSSYGVYLRKNNFWAELFYNDLPVHVHGSSEINIFAVGDLGRIFHWNGKDWIRFSQIEDATKILYDVWTNNIETFIVGNDGLKTYILHGK